MSPRLLRSFGRDLVAVYSPETMSSGRYMSYSPSPSTAPHSPHVAGLRLPRLLSPSKRIQRRLGFCSFCQTNSQNEPYCCRLLNQDFGHFFIPERSSSKYGAQLNG